MYRITNNSGAHVPLDNELNLGPHQTLTVNSIPRALSRIQKFVTIERVQAQVQKPKPVLQDKPVSPPVAPPVAPSESSEPKSSRKGRRFFDSTNKGEN
jgi:hypothetical protein